MSTKISILSGLMDGQVLQRDSKGRGKTLVKGLTLRSVSGPVRVRVKKNGRILSGFKTRIIGQCRNGAWQAILDRLPTGGKYDITFTIGPGMETTVKKVMVGDVWVLAGQSNMKGVGDVKDALKPHPLVHAYYHWEQWGVAREPIGFLEGSPDPIHTPSPLTGKKLMDVWQQLPKGVGPGLAFAREMVKFTGVPQGLIPCAQGGTSLERWSPKLKGLGGGSLYGSMLRRFKKVGQPIKGMLWYQGESDGGLLQAPKYTSNMKKMVAAVRRDFKQPDLPWITVQLAGVVGLRWCQPGWVSVRDQQRLLPKIDKKMTMVPAIDLPLEDEIHVSAVGHNILGRRMARAACSLLKLKKGIKPPITVKKIRYVPSDFPGFEPDIEVSYNNVTGKLVSDGFPTGFALVDQDDVNLHAVCRVFLEGTRVRIRHAFMSQLPKKLFLAYGFELDGYCNIHDEAGMGLPGFAPQKIEKG